MAEKNITRGPDPEEVANEEGAFEESRRNLAISAIRLRSLLDATRLAVIHGEEPEIIFDADSVRGTLDIAVLELDKIFDASEEMGITFRGLRKTGGAA